MDEEVEDTTELWICNECGEEWPDSGDPECPFCASTDTMPKEDDKTDA